MAGMAEAIPAMEGLGEAQARSAYLPARSYSQAPSPALEAQAAAQAGVPPLALLVAAEVTAAQ